MTKAACTTTCSATTNPRWKRFTTQDPIGLEGGLNLYAYGPNPLTWIDPFGLSFLRS
nr:RHS repeat-associated core domain-containing protein [Serratia marcescens]